MKGIDRALIVEYIRTFSVPVDHTILVSDVAVEVNLSILPVTVLVSETGSEDVVVVDADIFGGEMERHIEMYVRFVLRCEVVKCGVAV